MRVFILSQDHTCAKQIMSAVHRLPTHDQYAMDWYHEDEWHQFFSGKDFLHGNHIYFVDTSELRQSFIEIVREIRKKDPTGNIILISWYDSIESICDTHLKSFITLRKSMDLVDEIVNVLKQIEREGSVYIQATDREIPIFLNEQRMDHIYTFPKEQVSLQYHTNRSKLLFTFQNPSREFQNITQNQFYVNQQMIEKRKRKTYAESQKRLAVDLYLIAKYDPEKIGTYLNVPPKYIVSWSKLSKYQRKHWWGYCLIRKWILKIYFNL